MNVAVVTPCPKEPSAACVAVIVDEPAVLGKSDPKMVFEVDKAKSTI